MQVFLSPVQTSKKNQLVMFITKLVAKLSTKHFLGSSFCLHFNVLGSGGT